MTRPLHKDTRVQRGRSANHRAQERRDASPWRVVSVVAAFLSLIPIGLGVAALVANSWRGDHHPSAGAAARADRQPPAPRLLADPEQARLRLEAAARRRLERGPIPIDKAMADVAKDGWDEGAAPSTAQVARDHRRAAP